MSDTNTAEVAVRAGINEMKGQLFITEAFTLFDNGRTQHLFGTHAAGTPRIAAPSLGKVLQNHLVDDRQGVEDIADAGQFTGPGVVDVLRHERHLFLVFFAHFLVGSFLTFVVISFACRFFITKGRRICPP